MRRSACCNPAACAPAARWHDHRLRRQAPLQRRRRERQRCPPCRPRSTAAAAAAALDPAVWWGPGPGRLPRAHTHRFGAPLLPRIAAPWPPTPASPKVGAADGTPLAPCGWRGAATRPCRQARVHGGPEPRVGARATPHAPQPAAQLARTRAYAARTSATRDAGPSPRAPSPRRWCRWTRQAPTRPTAADAHRLPRQCKRRRP